VTIISSPDPTERALEPGVMKEGYFEVKEDVKCLMNVRAARIFPFWRYLEFEKLSGSGVRRTKKRTGVYHEERNDLGSFQQTSLPSSQPKLSHYPASQQPRDEVLPLRTRPLVSSHSRNYELALSRYNSAWFQ